MISFLSRSEVQNQPQPHASTYNNNNITAQGPDLAKQSFPSTFYGGTQTDRCSSPSVVLRKPIRPRQEANDNISVYSIFFFFSQTNSWAYSHLEKKRRCCMKNAGLEELQLSGKITCPFIQQIVEGDNFQTAPEGKVAEWGHARGRSSRSPGPQQPS